MLAWSRPLVGSAQDRIREVARHRALGILWCALALLPVVGLVGVGIAPQLMTLLAVVAVSPAFLWAVRPRVRCALADSERRTVALLACQPRLAVEPTTSVALVVDAAARVAVTRATANHRVAAVAAGRGRLSRLVHICLLAARVATAQAAARTSSIAATQP